MSRSGNVVWTRLTMTEPITLLLAHVHRIAINVLSILTLLGQKWSWGWVRYVPCTTSNTSFLAWQPVMLKPWYKCTHIQHYTVQPRLYIRTSFIQNLDYPDLLETNKYIGWWSFRGVATCLGQNWLTSIPTCIWMLLTMTMPYIHRLMARYHKSGEKSGHFSYLDYFTYPVCQWSALGQRGPDNQGCTVLFCRLLV